jgi:glycosyltransferase involved in cell wall biosynthesis
LIPLNDPENYLAHKIVKNWYDNKIEHLKNSDLILAISDFTKIDAINKLKLNPEKITNISGATNLHRLFKPANIKESILPGKLNNSKFIFYAGGFDKRKRVSEIINALSNISKEITEKYLLVFAGKISETDKDELTNIAISKNFDPNILYFLGHVNDLTLAKLYSSCHLFIFPSENEGFGLTPLEAMTFGAPVISSNRASLSEIISHNELMFNPDDLVSFSTLLENALENEDFRVHMRLCSLSQSQKFSWENSSLRVMNAIENQTLNVKDNKVSNRRSLLKKILNFFNGKIE